MKDIQIRDATGAVDLHYPAGRGAEIIDDRPERDMRAGTIVAVLFFVLFLGWAAFARLDADAYAPRRLTVAGQRQSVKPRDGGVVGATRSEERRLGKAWVITVSFGWSP